MLRFSTVIVGLVILIAATGCGRPKLDAGIAAERQAAYSQLAIVVAPGPGADAQYASGILSQAKTTTVSRLAFLKRVDFPTGVTVDTSTTPPTPTLGPSMAGFDALCCLVYSYKGTDVVLDLHMFDAKTGQHLWTTSINKSDANVKARLMTHGFWAPTYIKQFYGHK